MLCTAQPVKSITVMVENPMKYLRILLMMLTATIVACNLNINLPSAPKPPIPSFAASESDANAFEQSFQSAIDQVSQTGTFSATINQNQFSSWLALRASSYAQQQGYEWPLKDVQAALDNGSITLYGVIIQKNLPETPAQVIFTPSIDANGQLSITVASGQVGIVGVPQDVLNGLTQTIKDTIDSQLAQIQGRYRLTGLGISGGNLTINGQIVQ
jgi:hypothetical protein